MAEIPQNENTHVTTAMETLSKNFGISNDNGIVLSTVQERTKKELGHAVELKHLGEHSDHASIKTAVGYLHNPEQMNAITTGFKLQTYKMKVANAQVEIEHNSKVFMETIILNSIDAISKAIDIQNTSFAIEVFLFLFNIYDIKFDIDELRMRNLVDNVMPLVQKPEYREAIEKFLQSWNEEPRNLWRRAKAIFKVLHKTYTIGIMWTIIELLVNQMALIDKFRALAEITAMLTVVFATEGVALIAKIALAIDDTAYICTKIENLVTFGKEHKKHNNDSGYFGFPWRCSLV